ncbi:hypothetical protein FXO37_28726 [Capsicum annuum]|nr:hypothetical protein FXO37_28726 [Capsicum annuum]
MQEHSERVQYLVNDALDKGAEIIARGSVGNIGEGGSIFLVSIKMKVAYLTPYGNCAQAFGPILPITKFISDVEAVQIANDSSYGLGCAVFSGSQRRARQIASQLHCGVAAAVSETASNYMCQAPTGISHLRHL